MDVRGYIGENAASFFGALREWLAIPSISADPAHHAGVRLAGAGRTAAR